MDLGIAGKRALVCAASKGLGRGCALALASNGVEVTITARNHETLEAAAKEIADAVFMSANSPALCSTIGWSTPRPSKYRSTILRAVT
jgi:3-oxoacyl-[acyl-carrier protein] reductase